MQFNRRSVGGICRTPSHGHTPWGQSVCCLSVCCLSVFQPVCLWLLARSLSVCLLVCLSLGPWLLVVRNLSVCLSVGLCVRDWWW